MRSTGMNIAQSDRKRSGVQSYKLSYRISDQSTMRSGQNQLQSTSKTHFEDSETPAVGGRHIVTALVERTAAHFKSSKSTKLSCLRRAHALSIRFQKRLFCDSARASR